MNYVWIFTDCAAGKLHYCHGGVVYGPIGQNLLGGKGAYLFGISDHPAHKLDCVVAAADYSVAKSVRVLTPSGLKVLVVVGIFSLESLNIRPSTIDTERFL